ILLAPAHARRRATAQGPGILYQFPRAVPCYKPARGGGSDREQEDTPSPAALPGCRISAAGWHCLAPPGDARVNEPAPLDVGRAARGGQCAAFCPGRTGGGPRAPLRRAQRLPARWDFLWGLLLGPRADLARLARRPQRWSPERFFTRSGDLLQLRDAHDAGLR